MLHEGACSCARHTLENMSESQQLAINTWADAPLCCTCPRRSDIRCQRCVHHTCLEHANTEYGYLLCIHCQTGDTGSDDEPGMARLGFVLEAAPEQLKPATNFEKEAVTTAEKQLARSKRECYVGCILVAWQPVKDNFDEKKIRPTRHIRLRRFKELVTDKDILCPLKGMLAPKVAVGRLHHWLETLMSISNVRRRQKQS